MTGVGQLDTPAIRTGAHEHLDTPAALNSRTPGFGQLVISTSALKQLDTLAIRTSLSSSNWTLQLSAQELTSIRTLPLPLTSGHLDSNTRTGSLSTGHSKGPPQPELGLTLAIRTRVPKHCPIRCMDSS